MMCLSTNNSFRGYLLSYNSYNRRTCERTHCSFQSTLLCQLFNNRLCILLTAMILREIIIQALAIVTSHNTDLRYRREAYSLAPYEVSFASTVLTQPTSSSSHRLTRSYTTSKVRSNLLFIHLLTTFPHLTSYDYSVFPMPKDFRNSTRHHCPLRNGSKGNCRRLNGYCSAHQIKCLIHTTVHLLGEPCQDCEVSNSCTLNIV